MEYGIQLYSVRDLAEKDLAAALEAVAKMGYTHVEFAGFFGHPAKEVKAIYDSLTDKLARGINTERESRTVVKLALGYRKVVVSIGIRIITPHVIAPIPVKLGIGAQPRIAVLVLFFNLTEHHSLIAV